MLHAAYRSSDANPGVFSFASCFERRYVLIDKSKPDQTYDDLFSDKIIVKIAGKNNIHDNDFNAEVQKKVERSILKLVSNPETNLVLVFDGDWYEPNSAPFSKLIHDLAPRVHAVVAVKKDPGSRALNPKFVESWKTVSNMKYVQIGDEEDPNVWNTERAHYIVNLYSDLHRYRDDGTETTGYAQLKQQMESAMEILPNMNDASGIVLLRMKRVTGRV